MKSDEPVNSSVRVPLVLLFAVAIVGWLGPGCEGRTDLRASKGGSGSAASTCDGSVLNGVWLRNADGLEMTLAANGCTISGTVDSATLHHAIAGSYDDAARTMQGTIKRTSLSSGCTTVMPVTLVLSDDNHFVEAITETDGQCDLPTTYNEASVWVRE